MVDYLLPVNGNLNRIIGIDQAGTILITSDNAFVSTGIYDVDKPTTTLRVINDELILRPYGITMVNIPSLSVYGNLNPFGINFGVYDLTYINWYHEGGGQDVYKIIAKLISFASLFKLTNEQNELVNYKQAVNGSLQTMGGKISLQFAKPNSVDKYSIVTVNEIKKQVPKITDSIVTDYEQVQTTIDPKTYYRYSGDYKPKLKKILWFKTDKLELCALVAVFVPLGFQIAKRQCRAAWKRPRFLGVVPVRVCRLQPVRRPIHQRAWQRQVSIRPPQNQRRIAWRVRILQRRHQQRRAFAAARRAAIQRLQVRQEQKRRLFSCRRLRNVFRCSRHHQRRLGMHQLPQESQRWSLLFFRQNHEYAAVPRVR